MTDSAEEKGKVGYRRPPGSGQFRKGQSGNPSGRPRKRNKVEANGPGPFPTLEALIVEAEREIAVTDASGRQVMPARQAVLRALVLGALRGGVGAQRTLVTLLRNEEDRLAKERLERFEYWRAYQDRCEAEVEAARKKDEAPPDFLPHPDDIRLNWRTWKVRFLGPVDEAQRDTVRWAEQVRDLAYEMACYLEEDNRLPTGAGDGGQIGLYMLLMVAAMGPLPPRLKPIPAALADRVSTMIYRDRQSWGIELAGRCADLKIPFTKWRPHALRPTATFAQAGINWRIPEAALAQRRKLLGRK